MDNSYGRENLPSGCVCYLLGYMRSAIVIPSLVPSKAMMIVKIPVMLRRYPG
ncbi:unnamed protein product [Natator depressus]